MNAIFTTILLLSLLVSSFFSPNVVLSSFTEGGQKALNLSLNLISIYSVWSGFLQISENCGIIKKISKIFRPTIKKIFNNPSDDVIDDIAVNISANLLGTGGIATPSGISAATKLCESSNHDGACALLVLASSGMQLMPTTVISLRKLYSSSNPSIVYLPSLLSAAVCTSIGLLLCFIFKKRKK